MLKKWFTLFAVTIIVAALLAGCAAPKATPTPAPAAKAAPAATPLPAAATTKPAAVPEATKPAAAPATVAPAAPKAVSPAPAATTTVPAAPAAQKGFVPKAIGIGTSTLGGTFYNVGISFAKVIQKYTNIPTTGQLVTGNQGRQMLYEKTWPIMLSSGNKGYDFMKASPGYGKDLLGFTMPESFWMAGYDAIWQVLVRRDSRINTFADLVGKGFIFDFPGTEYYHWEVDAAMKLYGKSKTDVKAMRYTSVSENNKAVIEGTAAASMTNVDLMAPAYVEAFQTAPVKLLGFESMEQAEKVCSDPRLVTCGFRPFVIPANAYRGQDKPVITMALPIYFELHKDLDIDLVYNLTKVILEHQAELAETYPVAGDFNKVNALKMLGVGPHHPGAIRYYKEIGIWPKDGDEKQQKALEGAWYYPNDWLWR